MSIHRSALAFGNVAAEYERGRPDYPDLAVRTIADALGLRSGKVVVDLAAGTGKFSRALVNTGASLIAIEPIGGMRRELERALPEIQALNGTAERIPLPDDSVDGVTVAQAFHWFQGDEALEEIHRVLVPGGGLALIWNWRDEEQPLHRAMAEIIEPYRGDTPAHRTGAWRDAFHRTELFTPLGERHVPHSQVMDAEGLVARVLSISFISALPEHERRIVASKALALADQWNGPIEMKYRTDVYWCFARPPA